MTVCVNCNIAIRVCEPFLYDALSLGPDIILILEEWTAREVRVEDYVCKECFTLLLTELNNRSENNVGTRQVGHKAVCICCGKSVSKRSGRRFHTVTDGCPERPYIASFIEPRQIPVDAQICHACWNRAYYRIKKSPRDSLVLQNIVKAESISKIEVSFSSDHSTNGQSNTELASGESPRDSLVQDIVKTESEVEVSFFSDHSSDGQSTTEPPRDALANQPIVKSKPIQTDSSCVVEPLSGPSSNNQSHNIHQIEKISIELNGYSRTPDTSGHCFIPECTNHERLRVPLYLKKQILVDHKLYVTPNARVCQEHASVDNWEMLNNYFFTKRFTQPHIVQMLDLLRINTL